MADLKKHVQAWRCSGLGLMGAALHQQKHVVSTKIAAEGIHMYVSCLLCNRELMIGFAPKTYMDPEGRNLQEMSCFFWAASDTAPKSTGYLQHFRQNFGNGHASEEDHLGMNFCRFTGHVLHFLNPKGPDFPVFLQGISVKLLSHLGRVDSWTRIGLFQKNLKWGRCSNM